MKKVFLSYRITGENREELKIVMEKVSQSLKTAGFDCFYSFQKEKLFQENSFSLKQILEYALEEIDKTDCVLVLLKSQEKSEGMLLEVGYALAKKKKIILVIKKGIEPVFLKGIASQVLEFEDLDDLYEKLSNVKL